MDYRGKLPGIIIDENPTNIHSCGWWLVVMGSPTFLKRKWDCLNCKNYSRIIVIFPHANPTTLKWVVCLWRKGQDNRGISSRKSDRTFLESRNWKEKNCIYRESIQLPLAPQSSVLCARPSRHIIQEWAKWKYLTIKLRIRPIFGPTFWSHFLVPLFAAIS